MNKLPTRIPMPDDSELDRLFSDFFKSQLKRPWPNAPFPTNAASGTSSTGTAEPSELAAVRHAETPRNQPGPASRDNTARARLTLAASVALMLGTCWYLSNGFQPSDRPTLVPSPSRPPHLLEGGGASGTDHAPLLKIQEDKAKENESKGGTKIDMGKFE